MAEDLDAQRELIALACRTLGELEITKAALGHISVRLGDTDRMLIKGKGPDEVGLRFTQPRDIIVVDFNANAVDSPHGLQPPSETFIHIWQFKTRPEVKSVIHMHPEHAVLLTIGEKPLVPAVGNATRFAMEGVPVYPRSITITTDELGQDLARVMGNHSACFMRGHGVTVVGDSVEESTLRTIALNEVCTMMYRAYALGTPQPVLPEDIEERMRPMPANRPRGNAGGRAGMMSRWRYFTELAEEKARGGAPDR
jgi:ribulose-5-phosphate 4-epimerase/fuculose-1-phosphate aldolase